MQKFSEIAARVLSLSVSSLLVAISLTQPAVAQSPHLREVAAKLASTCRDEQCGPIAVLKTSNDQGFDERFSNWVRTQLTALLTDEADSFQVVNSEKVDELQAQFELKYFEPYDPSSFPEFGKWLGARTLVTGSFDVQADTVELLVYLRDIESNTNLGVAFGGIPRTPRIENRYLGIKRQNAPIRSSTSPADGGSPTDLTPLGSETFKAYDHNQRREVLVRLGLYGCFTMEGRIVCRTKISNVDANSFGFDLDTDTTRSSQSLRRRLNFTRLKDDLYNTHVLSDAYFLNRLGQPIRTVNLGANESVWLELEFKGSSDTKLSYVDFFNENFGIDIRKINLDE